MEKKDKDPVFKIMNKSLDFYHKMTIEELLKIEDPILNGGVRRNDLNTMKIKKKKKQTETFGILKLHLG